MVTLAGRKGISPVIATVIIVAVAIAISIAVASWLFGLWGGFATGAPQISITSIRGSASGGTIEVYLINEGSGSDELIDVEVIVGNQSYTLGGGITQVSFGGQTINATGQTITIEANTEGWLTITIDTQTVTVNPGDTIQVALYFKQSGKQQFPVTLGP